MNDQVIYVSPQGKYCWSGRYEKPLKDGSDGPCFSPHEALMNARRLRRMGFANGRIKIEILPGEYFLYEPIRMYLEDRDISFVASKAGSVRIHSAVKIQGWEEQEVKGLKCWVAPIPMEFKNRRSVRTLFVDRERRDRSVSSSQEWHHFEFVSNVNLKPDYSQNMGPHFCGANEMILPPGSDRSGREKHPGRGIISKPFLGFGADADRELLSGSEKGPDFGEVPDGFVR